MIIKRLSFLLISSLSLCIMSCTNGEESVQKTPDSLAINGYAIKDTTLEKQDTLIEIHYSILVLNDSIRKGLIKQFNPEILETILAINRVDFEKVHKLDSLVVPDTFLTDFLSYSPFPPKLTIADSIDKLILLSYPLQAFSVYTKGELTRWGPVSMGKKSTPTPTGLFHTNWKSKKQVSTDNSSWILPWYFNIINATGVSFHQFELPGYPASHSCIRLREEDAKWIYNYADQWILDDRGWNIIVKGTPVILFGEYAYDLPAPWYGLRTNADTNTIQIEQVDSIINLHLKDILKDEINRLNYVHEKK